MSTEMRQSLDITISVQEHSFRQNFLVKKKPAGAR